MTEEEGCYDENGSQAENEKLNEIEKGIDKSVSYLRVIVTLF